MIDSSKMFLRCRNTANIMNLNFAYFINFTYSSLRIYAKSENTVYLKMQPTYIMIDMKSKKIDLILIAANIVREV